MVSDDTFLSALWLGGFLLILILGDFASLMLSTYGEDETDD